MKSFQKAFWLAIVFPVVACIDFASENETLTPMPLMVTARGTAFYGKDGIPSPGPVNQLCVGFTDRAIIISGSSPDRAQVGVPWRRKKAQLTVALVDNDSARVVLQFAGARKTEHGQSACFENRVSRDTDRRYYRGELLSDDSVLLYGVHWASGSNVESLRALANIR
jgi:hypothetical protein